MRQWGQSLHIWKRIQEAAGIQGQAGIHTVTDKKGAAYRGDGPAGPGYLRRLPGT